MYVGNAGFSAGSVAFMNLAISQAGEPYVAFQDSLNSAKATLMKFNGTNWVYVGNAGFSAGAALWASFAFSPSEQPFVAYADGGNLNKATVMKYDSVMVGVSESAKLYFSIYPNPSSYQITIETSANPSKSQLSISNINGQELITRQITASKTQLDISSLPSGVYFVRLTSEKCVVTGKFIKQ